MIALVLLLLCGTFHYSASIMCYECNSATNAMCMEGALSELLKRNCSEHDRGVTHTLCRKIIQHVDYEVNGRLPESRVIRTCGWDESKYKGKCYTRAGYGGRQEVCSCSTDYCNGGDSTTSYSIVTSTVLMYIVAKISQ